jgi:hypothetical protein
MNSTHRPNSDTRNPRQPSSSLAAAKRLRIFAQWIAGMNEAAFPFYQKFGFYQRMTVREQRRD